MKTERARMRAAPSSLACDKAIALRSPIDAAPLTVQGRHIGSAYQGHLDGGTAGGIAKLKRHGGACGKGDAGIGGAQRAREVWVQPGRLRVPLLERKTVCGAGR